MSRAKSIFLCAFLAACSVASAYTVILNNGKRVEGTFVEDRGSAIVIKDRGGILLTFKKATLNLDRMREENAGPSESPALSSIGPSPQTAPQDARKPGKPAKIYTRDDLKNLPELGMAGSEQPVESPEQEYAQSRPAQESPAPSFDPEAYWISQTREIRDRLRQVEADYEDLKRQCDDAQKALSYYVLNGYMFTNLAVAQDATYFCDQANQAKAELDRQQKDLEDYQDRARREGALPGWIDPDRIDP